MNNKILDILLKEVLNKDYIHIDRIKEYFKAEIFNEQSINMLAELIANPSYEELYPGDYFKVAVNNLKYQLANDKETWNFDIMYDLGLYDGTYIYGKVVTSDSYNHIEHRPYYYKMKINLFVYKDDKVIIVKEALNSYILIKTIKENIKYFKDGTDIKGIAGK